MLAQGADSCAWRVEEDVLDARRRERRCNGQVGAQEFDIAMAQSARQVTRVPESVEIEVHGDDAATLAYHLRKMRRLTPRRRRTIDDRRAHAHCEHARGHLRRLGLRVEEA